MKTSDFVLRSLWYNPELQRYLASLGFYEVGQSLLFNKTEANQIQLKSTLVIISTMLGMLGIMVTKIDKSTRIFVFDSVKLVCLFSLIDYIENGKVRTLSSSREVTFFSPPPPAINFNGHYGCLGGGRGGGNIIMPAVS